ncbi:MAG TPA: response regulator transcription factor [Vicinamibacterales bacterium]|jgi:DNA-binding response OmpR family regulator|nr:response regulator transcription factor [Vicinamibacterales bacterium]
MTRRILVVEDDGALARILRDNLVLEGFDVACVGDGTEALITARDFAPDLALVDVALPGISGLDLCARWRQSGRFPIIVLTARSEKKDKILGLRLGADDYITKPFDLEELLARVRAVLRRARPSVERLRLGQVTIDFVTLQAWSGSEAIELSHREFELLRYLAERPDRIVHRDELLREVWGYPEQPRTRAVDNAILRLRKKLEAEAHRPRFIHTVHGDGYCLTPAGSNQSPEGSEPESG